MSSMGIQLLASALCLLGWAGVIFSCVLPMWRVSAFVGTNIVTSQLIWEGIWMSCVVESTGHMQCKVYDSMLALTYDLQAARALMVIAIATGGAGLILAFVGGKCTRFLDEESRGTKSKLAIAAGAVLISTGVLCLIASTWAAGTVVRDFYSTSVDSQRRELGACLYIGWGAAILLVLGGIFFIHSACPIKEHDTNKSPSVRYVVVRSSKSSIHAGSHRSRAPTAMAQPIRLLSSKPQSTQSQPYSRTPWDNGLEQISRGGSERSWMRRPDSSTSECSKALSTKSQLKRLESAMSERSDAPSSKSQLLKAEMEETLAAISEKDETLSDPPKTYL
nr:claudin-4 [Nothobranchius furzeri]